MESPPRHYVALAFLPVVIALITLVALLVYQRGAEERRDRWQQPEAVLDAVGVRPGMRVAESHPSDTYFLERLVARVGETGSVYAVRPSARVVEGIEARAPRVRVVSELPPGLDVLLDLHVSANDQEIADVSEELREAGERLASGARVGFIGVRGEGFEHVLSPDGVAEVAAAHGFRLARKEDFLDRQFLLVLEKE
jgi:predicted methyltransferase